MVKITIVILIIMIVSIISFRFGYFTEVVLLEEITDRLGDDTKSKLLKEAENYKYHITEKSARKIIANVLYAVITNGGKLQ